MDCIIQGINILCSDIQLQSSFISFLFDVEINFDEDGEFFYLGGLRFNLVQSESAAPTKTPLVELRVSGTDDLSSFKQKYEFFLYKSQSDKIAALKSSFNPEQFEFEDPNGNLWRIAVSMQTSTQKPQSLELGPSSSVSLN